MPGDAFPSDWSSTASSNSTVGGGVNIAENCAMAGLNNGERAIMAAVKGNLSFPSASGGDSYTATLIPAPGTYSTASYYGVNITAANTSSTATLNFNALGAKTLTRGDGSALQVGDLNGPHALEYDGTSLRVLNPVQFKGSAANITSGTLALARGGTNADLSATGGTSQVLKQTSTGSAVTVAQLASTDLSDALTIVLTSSTGRLVRTGQGTTAGGTTNVTFSSTFPASCDGVVVTGAGSSAIFFANGIHAATATIASSGGDGAFYYVAFGH